MTATAPLDTAGIAEAARSLRNNLAGLSLPPSVRDAVERITAWSPGADGNPDALEWVRAASADLLAVVLAGTSLLPATRTLACRALRLADLVRGGGR